MRKQWKVKLKKSGKQILDASANRCHAIPISQWKNKLRKYTLFPISRISTAADR